MAGLTGGGGSCTVRSIALERMAEATGSERDLAALGALRTHVAAILDQPDRLPALPVAPS